MRILLDTHVFLWLIVDDPRLSASARQVIADKQNELLLSAASAWEFAIKVRSGKLMVSEPPDTYWSRYMTLYKMQPLAVQIVHALHTFRLPLLHRDPFDRLLVSQSQTEGIPLLTDDELVRRYPLQVLW